MTYRLKFLPVALKEWEKLAPPLREQFNGLSGQRPR
jgi:mRNA interferase RelE/StbE